MRTIRITITSQENTDVVLREKVSKQPSIKEKLSSLFRKLSVQAEPEKQ